MVADGGHADSGPADDLGAGRAGPGAGLGGGNGAPDGRPISVWRAVAGVACFAFVVAEHATDWFNPPLPTWVYLTLGAIALGVDATEARGLIRAIIMRRYGKGD